MDKCDVLHTWRVDRRRGGV